MGGKNETPATYVARSWICDACISSFLSVVLDVHSASQPYTCVLCGHQGKIDDFNARDYAVLTGLPAPAVWPIPVEQVKKEACSTWNKEERPGAGAMKERKKRGRGKKCSTWNTDSNSATERRIACLQSLAVEAEQRFPTVTLQVLEDILREGLVGLSKECLGRMCGLKVEHLQKHTEQTLIDAFVNQICYCSPREVRTCEK